MPSRASCGVGRRKSFGANATGDSSSRSSGAWARSGIRGSIVCKAWAGRSPSGGCGNPVFLAKAMAQLTGIRAAGEGFAKASAGHIDFNVDMSLFGLRSPAQE